jgi:HAD superfamily hydrolase (TIGR01490 family)
MLPATPPRSIAFFDVDNTLLRGASLYHLGVLAWRRGLITGRDIASFGWKQARFLAVGENRDHLSTICSRALEVAVGFERAELVGLSEEIFDTRLIRRLWPETVAVARRHLEVGREVWLLTASVQEVADVMANRLGFTGALGTVLEADDGVFTGRLIDGLCHGHTKSNAARARAEASDVDLADCWAYSDSHNDIPLLDLVGNPVVVNPDAVLERYATERDWPVMRLNRASIRQAARVSKKR